MALQAGSSGVLEMPGTLGGLHESPKQYRLYCAERWCKHYDRWLWGTYATREQAEALARAHGLDLEGVSLSRVARGKWDKAEGVHRGGVCELWLNDGYRTRFRTRRVAFSGREWEKIAYRLAGYFGGGVLVENVDTYAFATRWLRYCGQLCSESCVREACRHLRKTLLDTPVPLNFNEVPA